MSDKPREWLGVAPGGNADILVCVMEPDYFRALRGNNPHPEEVRLIEYSAFNRLRAENERLKEDVERHASVDYWHERGRAAEAERDRLKLIIESHTRKFANLGRWALDQRPPGVSPIVWMEFIERLCNYAAQEEWK